MGQLKIKQAQPKLFDNINHLIQKEQVASAYLFAGRAGVGTEEMAEYLSLALLCDHQESRPCYHCASCVKVANKAHESLLWVEPEGAHPAIKVQQAKGVQEFMSFRSLSKRRVVIFNQAETMNVQSGNMLLKLIEDPPEGSCFLFLTSSLGRVLPTIRSRCQVIRFPLLSEEILEKVDPGLPRWVYRSSFGSVAQLQKVKEERTKEIRQLAVQILEVLSEGQPRRAMELFEPIVNDRDEAFLWTQLFEQIVRDLVVKTSEGEAILHVDLSPFYDRFAAQFENLFWSELIKKLFLLKRDLQRGSFDKSLLMEQFFYQISSLASGSEKV